MVLNLCSTVVPEIDPHRTAPTELPEIAGKDLELTSQSHALSTEKPRRWPVRLIGQFFMEFLIAFLGI
jgi:hypothetical protein